ncbi:pantoate--beta-alanine ligase [Thiomicrorhabdus indica]|uniref:pantoate--beta-alanine ligase n=1 Tax=Thiomicrorhabdus indica TaxID=2267253 RepID=UPI002AA6B8A6|nr:pantoate--beta-alanine ligase [Thiomicrorhabdus indica]
MSLQVIQTLSSLQQLVAEWRNQGLSIGLVPTMGNLHQGHLSLVEAAQAECDKVVVSIFVNPLQFGEGEDFDSYPRTYQQDEERLREISADCVFYPSIQEMYPNGQQGQTLVQVPSLLTGLLEGALRPGHFDGVTTVVMKLFNMVQPDVAVFGQKDFQQCAVIQKMVEDLCVPVNIKIAPIARDEDGLALSSRNQYLDASQRQIAPVLYQQLQWMSKELLNANQKVAEVCKKASENLLNAGFSQVDYIQVCQVGSLLPVDLIESEKLSCNYYVVLVVARLGKTRLLDNLLL